MCLPNGSKRRERLLDSTLSLKFIRGLLFTPAPFVKVIFVICCLGGVGSAEPINNEFFPPLALWRKIRVDYRRRRISWPDTAHDSSAPIAGWPSPTADSKVLGGILLLSLLPLGLLLADLVVERGAVVEYKGLKLDFSRVSSTAPMASAFVPRNIGVPGKPVSDSDTTEIMATLSSTVDHDVAVVNLEDGDAWWETRLLVLAAGAARRQRPNAIVFTGTDGGVADRFQGWGSPRLIVERLLADNPVYQTIFDTVEAAARQWERVAPNPIGSPAGAPPAPSCIDGIAATYFRMAFDGATGLANPLRFEQLLASELGGQVEKPNPPRGISLVRLEDLFRPILRKGAIDENWPNQQQLEAFFSDNEPYIAITTNGCYQRLLPRSAAQNAILKSLVTPTKTA